MNILPPGCKTNDCTGIAADAAAYSLSDAKYFNGTPVSVVVICPVGGVGCTPGDPVVVTYPPGTFVFPDVEPEDPDSPTTLCLTGCQSQVCRTLAVGATEAQINAAVAEIINEVATQQAECDLCPGCSFGATLALSNLPAYACLGSAYSQSITATTNPVSNPVSFSVSGTLPTGITLSATTPTTATLSGTPTTAGTYNFTMNAQAANGTVTAKAYSVTVVGITTAAALPDAPIDDPYSQALAVSGIAGTLIWGIAAGTLPAGLAFNTTTGVISGTPTTVGTSAFTVFVQNETQQCLKAFTIEVDSVVGDCSVFEDIAWSAPVISGTASGVSATNSITGAASITGPGGSFVQFNGTVPYSGPELSCNVNIDASTLSCDAGFGSNAASIQITISSDIDGVLLTEVLTNAEGGGPDFAGIYDFPFTVPLSAGATLTIFSEFNAGVPDNAGSAAAGGVITIGAP